MAERIAGWECHERDGDRKAERHGCKLIRDATELSIDVRDSGGVEFVPLGVIAWLLNTKQDRDAQSAELAELRRQVEAVADELENGTYGGPNAEYVRGGSDARGRIQEKLRAALAPEKS